MKNTLAQTFARAVRAARRARGLTQAELAERSGLAVEAYGRLERGATLPRADTLAALARALAVSTDELLGLDASALVARDVQPADEVPADVRRLVELLGSFTPTTRRTVLAALRAVAGEGAPRAAARKRGRRS